MPRNKSVKLSKDTLRDNGITYFENYYEQPNASEFEDVPEHVLGLRDELLDFDQIIFRQDAEDVLGSDGLGGIPSEAIFDTLPRHLRRGRERIKDPNIELSVELMSKAEELVIKDPPEWGWTKLVRDLVFKENERPPGRSSVAIDIAHHIAFGGEDAEWKESGGLRQPAAVGPRLSMPKPDIYLGFPMHLPEDSMHHSFKSFPHFQNFTLKTLGQLLRHGLVPSPTSPFRTQAERIKIAQIEESYWKGPVPSPTSSLRTKAEKIARIEEIYWRGLAKHQRLCFPWVIIEVKVRHPQKCYCQAANAASISLCLFERLAKYADEQPHAQHIPPIVAFTILRAEVRLWIAYIVLHEDGHRDHTMICVWAGSIKEFWGAFQLYRIVEKLYFWGLHILKPQISMYIDRWRHRHIPANRPSRSVSTPRDESIVEPILLSCDTSINPGIGASSDNSNIAQPLSATSRPFTGTTRGRSTSHPPLPTFNLERIQETMATRPLTEIHTSTHRFSTLEEGFPGLGFPATGDMALRPRPKSAIQVSLYRKLDALGGSVKKEPPFSFPVGNSDLFNITPRSQESVYPPKQVEASSTGNLEAQQLQELHPPASPYQNDHAQSHEDVGKGKQKATVANMENEGRGEDAGETQAGMPPTLAWRSPEQLVEDSSPPVTPTPAPGTARRGIKWKSKGGSSSAKAIHRSRSSGPLALSSSPTSITTPQQSPELPRADSSPATATLRRDLSQQLRVDSSPTPRRLSPRPPANEDLTETPSAAGDAHDDAEADNEGEGRKEKKGRRKGTGKGKGKGKGEGEGKGDHAGEGERNSNDESKSQHSSASDVRRWGPCPSDNSKDSDYQQPSQAESDSTNASILSTDLEALDLE